MRGFLVRMGIDQTFGEWNAPVDLVSKEFVYVPIPEDVDTGCHAGLGRRYAEALPPLRDFCKRHGRDPQRDLRFPALLGNRLMHLDPDFEHLTYGDVGHRRGRGIATLGDGDLLAFYAGLRPICQSGDRLVYALVGLYIVQEVVLADDVPEARWCENAHTRRDDRNVPDIVVRAKRNVSGRLEECIPIGEWRDRAYRVRWDLLDAWGGLSVRDGYIQRSAVPPSFLDTARFYEWFLTQGIGLVPRNN